ncbi:TIM barrel protein [Zhihengliuella salsuginis]|uniref:Xylose isomerase-like TIM barrel domain-containing protein n=1 Tax=Zhihengliuella salsuginis TaxID=578222 RepID=A0ABQ3GGV4_9MICC|nr:TIM barrel protein [Zhihengliuella salsuginis]GHD05671.1 hypothetical protein GCM10008096_14910 [Zhihengliuella salsuginis]
MTGYLRGDFLSDDGRRELVATARQSLRAAEEIDVPRLNLHGTGLGARRASGPPRHRGRRAAPWIGEIQVADVPVRCEPGTGEIHYPAVAAALRDLGYTGVVGLEGWASGDPDAALEAFRAAFA